MSHMKLEDLKQRVEQLIALGNQTHSTGGSGRPSWVDAKLYSDFRTSTLSFILKLSTTLTHTTSILLIM